MNRFWKDKTAFVTGSTGFVGSHIVRLLVENGAKVICLQRDEVISSALDLFDLRNKVSVVKGEIEDLALLERILNEYEVDSVFHFAAQALAGIANRSPLSTFETNIRGTYLLLEACRLTKRVERVLVASSENAYGTKQNPPYSEDFPLQGENPYHVSKSCADLIAQSFASTYNLPVTIVRPANTYGGGDLNLSRIIPGTILSILKNECPIIRSDGSPVREFIHIQDVAEACLLLAENIHKSKGEAFNIGSNEPIKMIDLVKLILELMGKSEELPPEILLRSENNFQTDAQFLSHKKMLDSFNWQAQIKLSEGLRQTIDWYRHHVSKIA